jgi:uncharacterized membrane protein YcaP (DUF421 family)
MILLVLDTANALRSLYHTDLPWWSLVLRAIIAYAAVLVLLRLAGKRQVGQMAMPEFVALLLISNAVQNSMNGGDNSLIAGLILASVLIVMSHLVSWGTFRSNRLERIVQGRPTLLIHRGKVLHENLQRELLSVRELKHILRRQSIMELSEIEEAVLEPDGFVSVLRKSEMPEVYQSERNDVY